MDQSLQLAKPIQPILEQLPPGWVTKTEAIGLLNRNVKTFEQIIKQRGIKSQLLKNPEKRATPIYLREEIERLVRPAPVQTAIAAVPTKPIQSRPIPSNPPLQLPGQVAKVPVNELHLITQKQAHELGYPYELLREMKARPNPPGIRYGKTGFRFSVPALRREMSAIGVG